MLTKEEQVFLEKRPMKRLTFSGMDDLYLHPWFGAYTIQQCIELEKQEIPKPKKLQALIPISDELANHNERCIERYGCGLFPCS